MFQCVRRPASADCKQPERYGERLRRLGLRQPGRLADERFVNTFARPALRRPRAARSITTLLVAAATSLTVLVSLWSAAPAGAIVEKVSGTEVGLQPPQVGILQDGPFYENVEKGVEFNKLPETFENPTGNPVLHGSSVYLVYWDPSNRYHNDWKALIDHFLENVNQAENSGGDVFAVDEQYTDTSNQPAYNRLDYRGSATDTTPYPSAGCTDPHPLKTDKFSKIGPLTCLTAAQIKTHLETYIAANKLPKGMSTVYYVLTPPGVAVCLDSGGKSGHCSDFENTEESYEDSFCSYHADINPGGKESGDANTILYGVLPWTAGGWGDGQLAGEDQTEAPYCQDGGFDPSNKSKYENPPKPRDKEEQEAFEKLEPEQQVETEIKRELEGPHIEEPNQQTCPTADGYCDEGLADLIVNQLAIEQQDIVTDPLLDSWKDSAGNEATDECRNFFNLSTGGSVGANEESGAGSLSNQSISGGNYYLQTVFNYAAEKLRFPGVRCLNGITLKPEFNSVSPIETNDTVGFDSAESIISLNAGVKYKAGKPELTYAKMKWNFGDGTGAEGYAPGSPKCEAPWLSECAESVYHTYAKPGTYTVTLTVTDVGGNVDSVSHEVTVEGPPEEAVQPPPATPSSSGSSSGSTPSAVSSTPPGPGGTTASGATVPLPVATAFVVSHSLKTALSKGVAVHYVVNEQVAGHFEVLLGQKMAKHLGIHGTLAGNLPAGSEPEVVIGTALVVTLKGGGSTTHVILTKSATSHLHHTKKLPLNLRLTVRNAAIHDPATAVVMSAFTLKV